MLSEPQMSKYVVEFLHAANRGATPTDSMRLNVDNESDAIAQAKWLARHTYCHHFQVRAVTRGVHGVIYRSAAGVRAA